MIDEIVIIGRPGLVGGADTELFDQIKVWLKMGLICRIVPTSESRYPINYYHPNLIIEEIGRYNSCYNKHVISYCNQYFLRDIEIIRKYAKTISWVNCMCFNFPKEIEAHKNGMIDFFLYQTKHQYYKCAPVLLNVNSSYNVIPIIPYFDNSSFPYYSSRNELKYGRISRSSCDKFSNNQFTIYKNAVQNRDVKGIVLGWSDILERYFNDSDQQYLKRTNKVDFLNQGSITSQEFYKQCGIVCISTSSFENLPRIAFESMSSGSVLIVDNRGGWKDLIDHKVTGFLCDDENDFIHYLQTVIDNPDTRNNIAKNARQHLEAKYSYEVSASRWEQFFKILT